ncbi:MAG: hypothetical protein EBY04_05970 [Actinobacteria bacterium]|nr:hypothetical protein [Actinomycetota bacterium]
MIERYSTPEMSALFSDTARFARYLEIELHALDAQARYGAVPQAAAAACRTRAPQVDEHLVRAITEREVVTNHDVAAFVDVAQDRIGGPEAAWLHHGLTSSDVVDTAWCAMLRDAAELIDSALGALLDVLVREARAHRATVMVGRTHGIHAEPTTFGTKVALWALQVASAAHRGGRGARGIRRGAKGQFSHAAQAEPDFCRNTVGSGSRRARQSASRAAERRTVARTRHFTLVGRAHHLARHRSTDVLHDQAPHPLGRHLGSRRRPDAHQPRVDSRCGVFSISALGTR